ncbi:amidase signature enzyme [Aaosphaeria arxii CBS 175.79]|uniref:Amidase signature enzyme n=1 Tax=Aaosphaeria arxii CBS 175.79 TaxID=1450172 RepID=A0A6A5X7T2_9PLEO|nr:amidase signature enzyme [Aaosphaeria arxii CBS 175.79]KAF2009003.1 amidase signature enzyme [Aaosphaeria arxii CBS 175.79]
MEGHILSTYYPNQTPAGSSSGSAVGAALELANAAIGTETSGSIRGPVELSNVIGFKPSRGLIGTDWAIPILSRQDVTGTLTGADRDAAYLSNRISC